MTEPGKAGISPEVRPRLRQKRLALSGLLLFVCVLTSLISFKLKGAAGVEGALLGLVLGAGIAGVGQLLRRRAENAEGYRVVSAMLAATFSTIGLFFAATLAWAFLWPETASVALLSAIAIYLTLLFFQVLSA